MLVGRLDISCFFFAAGFFFQERDLRERPITSRTEYVRACAELSLSPIPVFDQLLALGNRSEPGSVGAEEEEDYSEDSPATTFGLDLRRYVSLDARRGFAAVYPPPVAHRTGTTPAVIVTVCSCMTHLPPSRSMEQFCCAGYGAFGLRRKQDG